MMISSVAPEAASRLLSFINASPTPFHATFNAAQRLESAGFRKLKEMDPWDKEIKAGGKYYFTRNQSTILAFTLPQSWKHGTGLSIVATHIDSPNLRIRPISKRERSGYLQVAVETYGGGLWHTWFDRDLSIAGRVITANKSGDFASKLVKIDRPILRIPNLAIHLSRGSADNFQFNQETEFVPVLGLISSQLNATKTESLDKKDVKASSVENNHHSVLLSLLAEELSVAPDEIHDFELHLYDTNPATLGGVSKEFIFSPRLDNQFSSFCAVDALVQSVSSSQSLPEGNVNVIALFNHEEVGSVSTTGAESNLVPSLLSRLSPTPETLAQSISRSFLLSCDMGHAIHPNYTAKHEDNHKPYINGGIVIKTNAKQRYTSDAIGSFIVKKLIENKGGKVQDYEVRNDMACGSTVGPHLSTIGVRTVDVGAPMLSMHSIRETAGSGDVQSCIDLFSALFEGFTDLDQKLVVE
ncbi:aspartyl aminopeptidase [Dendrothele bispora CBS 962.96]|uniref:aspartyl aminopeptidase n=1 Tax=Dendrothele bispora (strain CBS 962.96) TaxID=1314807 RepID=A0A4S8N0Q9_DENBC|nr:aspartyl aminopeptidase [Dendrothele bispora CBS 962.96]